MIQPCEGQKFKEYRENLKENIKWKLSCRVPALHNYLNSYKYLVRPRLWVITEFVLIFLLSDMTNQTEVELGFSFTQLLTTVPQLKRLNDY